MCAARHVNACDHRCLRRVTSYLSQGNDPLYVSVADVEVRDLLGLPGRGLRARRVLDVPVERLGRHQVDHVVHLKFQLHHLVRWTLQPADTREKSGG